MKIPNYKDICTFAQEHGLTDEDVYDQYRLGYCHFPKDRKAIADLNKEFQRLRRQYTLWTDDQTEFIAEISDKLGRRPTDEYKLVPNDVRKEVLNPEDFHWIHHAHQGTTYYKARPVMRRLWTERSIMKNLQAKISLQSGSLAGEHYDVVED